MEKIKNFLYDISDLLISALIIIIMFSALYYKLNTSISNNNIFNFITITKKNNINNENEDNIDSTINIDINNDNTNDKNLNNDTKNNENEINNSIDNNVNNDNNENISDSDIKEQNVDNENNISDNKDNMNKNNTDGENVENNIVEDNPYFVITIPAGSSGKKIANILVQNGVIQDSTSFLNELNKMNLSSRLRAGKFSVKKNMTNKQVINILTK